MEKITWKDAKAAVAKVNPELAQAIDQINPNDSYTLYRERYFFGDMVFNEGVLNIRNDANNLVPFNHHTIASDIKKDLSYRTIPMGIPLNKKLEVHAEIEKRVIPLTVISPGTPFGVWEAFDPMFSYFIKLSWNLSAGARSIFLLPKISKTSGYKKIEKEFGIKVNQPRRLMDQWNVFKSIVNGVESVKEQWCCDILLFSHKWFEQLQTKTWYDVQNVLLKSIWRQSMFWRFSATVKLVWQNFVLTLKSRNMKCGSYQLETLKHLITLGAGALPAFTAYPDNDLSAPILFLQEVFMEVYELDYAPTIMYSYHFDSANKNAHLYYSINEPTLIESVPKTREVSNVMQVTREIKHLFDDFKREVLAGTLMVDNTPICDLIDQSTFDFMHTSYDFGNDLIVSSRLPDKDNGLLHGNKKYSNFQFCHSSHFLRGCVRISP